MSHAGLRVAVLARLPAQQPYDGVAWRCAPRDAAGYGQQLYGTLRELDALGVERILVEAVPADDSWLAVRDRLRRAAHAADNTMP